MKKDVKFIFHTFIILFLFFTMFSGQETLAQDDVTVYEVNNVKEWHEAVKEIKELGNGNYIISLKSDIYEENIDGKRYAPNVSIDVPCNVTIIGNGHTIYFPAGGGTGSGISISDGATLNLGKEDGSDSLTLAGSNEGNDDGGLIYISEMYIKESMATGAVCNMYNGVVLKDRITSNYYGAGVSVNGIKTVFNMYGGTIQNCGFSSVASGSEVYGGGVSVNGGTFNMYDGIIRDCHAKNTDENFYGRGGGVFLTQYRYSQSKLNITGGTIENCSADIGGGIYLAYNYYPDSDSITNINNCKIINNHATYNGGGIYAAASHINISNSEITGNDAEYGGGLLLTGSNNWPTVVNMDDSCILCNNTATEGGSDIVANKSTITLPVASSMNRKYLASEPGYASQKKINGWYEDNEEDDETGTKRYKNQSQDEAILISDLTVDSMEEMKYLIAGSNGEEDPPEDGDEKKDDENIPIDDKPNQDEDTPKNDEPQEENEIIPEKNDNEDSNNDKSINNNTINEITNNVEQDNINKPNNTPNTGDNIKTYFIYFIISIVFLLIISLDKKQKTKGKH